MGSKAPVTKNSSEDVPAEESHFGRPDVLKVSAKNQLLGRIAGALQVPPAVLYNPPNAVTSVRTAGSSGASSIDLDPECEMLSDAYRCIHDPEMRLRLLRLVQAAAEQDKSRSNP